MPITTSTNPSGTDGPASARIGADDKLWAALRAHQRGTCAELATEAGIGRSTAAKILSRWAAENTVVRTAPAETGGAGRAPELWSILDPSTPVADAADSDDIPVVDDQLTAGIGEPTPDGDTDAPPPDPDGVASPAEVSGRPRRLPAGGLRGMVEDYLRERPGEAFGPSQIGKDLGRSSGAVANALVKLVEAGCVVVVQDRPLRYTLASSENAEPDAGATGPDPEPVGDAVG